MQLNLTIETRAWTLVSGDTTCQQILFGIQVSQSANDFCFQKDAMLVSFHHTSNPQSFPVSWPVSQQDRNRIPTRFCYDSAPRT